MKFTRRVRRWLARRRAINALAYAATCNPTMRVGQVIVNATASPGPPIFYLDDDELAEVFLSYAHESAS